MLHRRATKKLPGVSKLVPLHTRWDVQGARGWVHGLIVGGPHFIKGEQGSVWEEGWVACAVVGPIYKRRAKGTCGRGVGDMRQ